MCVLRRFVPPNGQFPFVTSKMENKGGFRFVLLSIINKFNMGGLRACLIKETLRKKFGTTRLFTAVLKLLFYMLWN